MVSRRFPIPFNGPYKPIGGYGVIGNTKTVALVGYDGSIDWCCLPRFDSPSVFAALLDRRLGGKWSLSPAGPGRASQAFEEDTNILKTKFETKGSQVVLTDFMPCAASSDAWSSLPEIHRMVQCVKGTMRLRLVLQPRFDYGRTVPKMTINANGIAIGNGRNEMALSSSLRMSRIELGRASKTFEMEKGDQESFVLSYGEAEPRSIEQYRSKTKLRDAESFWKKWADGLNYSGRWRNQVIRSALTLKMLVYSPTGAIVAAPTTSLPETIGGERNWDYRFSWIRDSALSLWAFHLLGNKGEAEKYHRWLVDNNPALDLDLKHLYRIDGGTRMTEKTLSRLKGYKSSGPVRVGNAASEQVQMDTYGYMLDALYYSSKLGSHVSEEMYHRFVRPLAGFIRKNWRKPDHSIWEIRRGREHYVYTKAWCYAGLDRAAKIARATGHPQDVHPWRETMRAIKREVLAKGWSKRRDAFVMSYEREELDSANLMIPLMGFLSSRSKSMIRTVHATIKELSKGPFLYRYNIDDGLRGKEGAFLACSFWLVACLARMGELKRARGIFEELLSSSNHLGLYSEEIIPETRELLGNFPQAFSHMGLIMAACELDRVLGRASH